MSCSETSIDVSGNSLLELSRSSLNSGVAYLLTHEAMAALTIA
jgi:hypothetical protein